MQAVVTEFCGSR